MESPIETFLSKLESQQNIEKSKQLKQEEERLKKIAEQNKYIEVFKSYYEATITPKLNNIKNMLSDKFDVKFNEVIKIEHSNFFGGDLSIKPNFESNIKSINTSIVAEGDRKLVSFSSQGKNTFNQDLPHIAFQGSLEEFKQLDLEAEVAKMLTKVFGIVI